LAKMAPGTSATFVADAQAQKQYLVVHEAVEQFKVVGWYPTEEEAYAAAVHKQINVFEAIKESVLGQVVKAFPERSWEWKLRMLQDALEAYFLEVGLGALTDHFTVTDQPITRKRKMVVAPRGDQAKLAKSNTSCGVASTTTLGTMAIYMYQTSPFGT
jgi:hypothetical protein